MQITLKSDDRIFPYFFKYASELSNFIPASFMAIMMTIQLATQNAGYVVLADAEIAQESSHTISHLKGSFDAKLCRKNLNNWKHTENKPITISIREYAV